MLAQCRTFRLRRAASSTARPELTAREDEVLGDMVEGLAAKAMTKRLGVATKTVEDQKIRIFDKLGVRTQAQAVAVAISHGLRIPGERVEHG
jgi:two-component system nitrate/nitrite response regulator NarL